MGGGRAPRGRGRTSCWGCSIPATRRCSPRRARGSRSPYAPLANPDLATVDGATVRERIDALELPADQRELLRAFWTLNFNGPIDDAAYTQAMRWCSLATGSWPIMFEACATFKLRDGTRALAEAIAADGDAEIRLEYDRREHRGRRP